MSERQLIRSKLGKEYAGDTDFYHEVADEKVQGHSTIYATGERFSMGNTSTGEDIWRGNELSPAPTSTTTIPTPSSAGEQMTIVSESANDTLLGSGAQKVMVHYLDAAGYERIEIVSLNGTTPVDLAETNARFINDLIVYNVGSGLVAAGHIKIYKKSNSGLVYNMIAVGGNKSLVANRMVPVNKTLLLRGWHASEAQGKRIAFRILSTSHLGTVLPGIFLFLDSTYIKTTGTGWLELQESIPSLAIIKVTGWPDQTAGEGSCSWRGILMDT